MQLSIKNFPVPVLILVLLTFIETMCCTYFLKFKNFAEITSIIYFIAGLTIAIFPLLSVLPPSNQLSPKYSFIKINKCLLYGFYGFIVIYLLYFFSGIIQELELDYTFSDTVPQIKVMCQRLLSGEKIYAPIDEIWEGKQPPYLPMMWLPFTLAEFLGIDVRWTTALFICAAIYLTYRILPASYSLNPIILFASSISLFLLVNFLLLNDRVTLGRTEEGIVISYYLFLGFALAKKKPILIGIAIACCLLSRFALFFWVPMYLVYVFFFESKKTAYTITTVIVAIILVVFLIPFGFNQPEYFINIPADYKIGVDEAWSFNYNPQSGKYYEHSLGYTKYFDISQIHFLHNLQIIVAAILPFLVLLLYKVLKYRLNLNAEFFGLCSLKLTLVFFYNMVEVPYYYLFFVSTFFSYAILMNYFKTSNPTFVSVADPK